MRLDRKSKSYAQALFTVAREAHCVQEVRESLQILAYLLKAEKLFLAFFQSRKITGTQKAGIVLALLKERCHPVAAEFFGLLADAKQWSRFRAIASIYENVARIHLNVVEVTAFSAIKLNPQEQDHIRKALEKALGRTTTMQNVVDPSLIAGLKLRMGNLFLDGSIQQRMNQLRTALLQS